MQILYGSVWFVFHWPTVQSKEKYSNFVFATELIPPYATRR